MQRWKAFLLATAFLVMVPGVVFATDNNTAQHWHDYDLITWDYDEWSSDAGWEFQVAVAFGSWESNTVVDFDKVTSSSDIEVSRGGWEDGFCSETASACARWFYWPITNHTWDADIWFNTDTVTWDSGNCNPTAGQKPRYSVALMEIGHAAGSLDHSSDSDAVMHTPIPTGDCKYLDSHDMDSMDEQYVSH